MESHHSFVSSLLGVLAHLGEDGHKMRTHTLTKPTPNLDQYQRELITGSCIFRRETQLNLAAPWAALQRRIPLERYKSPLPSIAFPVERYLLGKN